MQLIKKLFAAATIVFFAGCYNDKADQLYPSAVTCDTTNVTFTADILPIMTKSCATTNCHDAESQMGNYDLTGYAGLKQMVTNGKLMPSIRHESGADFMPKDLPKLADCDINKIARWVNLGAKQ